LRDKSLSQLLLLAFLLQEYRAEVVKMKELVILRMRTELRSLFENASFTKPKNKPYTRLAQRVL